MDADDSRPTLPSRESKRIRYLPDDGISAPDAQWTAVYCGLPTVYTGIARADRNADAKMDNTVGVE